MPKKKTQAAPSPDKSPEKSEKNDTVERALQEIKTKFGDEAIMKLGERPGLTGHSASADSPVDES